MSAQVINTSGLSVQVCVPAAWDDDGVKAFADRAHPCGTSNGWLIRREGDEALRGDPERQPCAQRDDYVHIVLDA